MAMTETDTGTLEEWLASAVARVIEDKEGRGVSPPLATDGDIRALAAQDIKAALNSMVRSGLLTFHRTLNGVAFEFTPPKRSNIKK